MNKRSPHRLQPCQDYRRAGDGQIVVGAGVRMSSARRRIAQPDNSAMRDTFERALRRRIAVNASGTVVLPTGIADVVELAKVLRAIERARQASDDR